MSGSEIRRLMQQIDDETQAMQRALIGPAIMASHDSINTRYDNLGRAQDELAQHIGEKAATDVVVRSYQKNLG